MLRAQGGVEGTGLMYYGAGFPSLWQLAAKYVAKILNGETPLFEAKRT
jgi:hypothetical protein